MVVTDACMNWMLISWCINIGVKKETIEETLKNGPSFINSQPSWQSKSTPDEGNEAVLEPGMAVLAVCFITNPLQESAGHRDAGAHRVLFGSHTGSAIK